MKTTLKRVLALLIALTLALGTLALSEEADGEDIAVGGDGAFVGDAGVAVSADVEPEIGEVKEFLLGDDGNERGTSSVSPDGEPAFQGSADPDSLESVHWTDSRALVPPEGKPFGDDQPAQQPSPGGEGGATAPEEVLSLDDAATQGDEYMDLPLEGAPDADPEGGVEYAVLAPEGDPEGGVEYAVLAPEGDPEGSAEYAVLAPEGDGLVVNGEGTAIKGIPRCDDGGYLYMCKDRWGNSYRWQVIGMKDDAWLLIYDGVLGGSISQSDAEQYDDLMKRNLIASEWEMVYNTSIRENDYEYSVDGSTNSGSYYNFHDVPLINGNKFFLLSAAEAMFYLGDGDRRRITGTTGWWLRSRARVVKEHPYGGGRYYDDDQGGFVFDDHTLRACYPGDFNAHYGARPALVIDPRGAFFFSPATGEKSRAITGGGSFGKLDAPSGDRKMTLIYDNLLPDLELSLSKTSLGPTETTTVTYSGFDNAFYYGTWWYNISAAICDPSGEILYYASVAADKDRIRADNYATWDITLPESIPDGDYTLKLFAEQRNGDHCTDYASTPKAFGITVKGDPGNRVAALADPAEGGSVEIDHVYAREGTKIQVAARLSGDYQFGKLFYTTQDGAVTLIPATVGSDGVYRGSFEKPAGAVAVTACFGLPYPLWVGGVQVNPANQDNITGPGITGGVSYEGDEHGGTLRLTDAAVTGCYVYEPRVTPDHFFREVFNIYTRDFDSLTIELAGSNTVSGADTSAISVRGELTITGSGSLTAAGGTGYGISGYAGVAILDTTVTATGKNTGIFSSTGNVDIVNSAVSAKGGDPIMSGQKITLTGAEITNPTGGYLSPRFQNYICAADGNPASEVRIEPTAPAVTARRGGALIATMVPEGENALTLTWTGVRGADGYDLFFKVCDGRGDYPLAASVGGGASNSHTFADLKKGTAYKAYVRAWAMNGDEKTYITDKSPTVHCLTDGSRKYANPTGLTLKKTELTIRLGRSATIRATVKGSEKGKKLLSHAAKLRYVSSDPSVATVSTKGKVKAKGPGSCAIYVLTNNGVYGRVNVTVDARARRVVFSSKAKTMRVGDVLNLAGRVKLSPAKAETALSWKSSRPDVAAVDESGYATALSKGKAVITVTTSNGKKAKLTIRVK